MLRLPRSPAPNDRANPGHGNGRRDADGRWTRSVSPRSNDDHGHDANADATPRSESLRIRKT